MVRALSSVSALALAACAPSGVLPAMAQTTSNRLNQLTSSTDCTSDSTRWQVTPSRTFTFDDSKR